VRADELDHHHHLLFRVLDGVAAQSAQITGSGQHTDDDAAMTVQERLVPRGRVHGGVVGVDVPGGDQLVLVLHRLAPLRSGERGHQLAAVVPPHGAGAVPDLDGVVRAVGADAAGPLRRDQTVGVILAVAVRVVLGERAGHLHQVLGGLGSVQAEVLQPVRTDDHAGSDHVPGAVDAVDRAVHAGGLVHVRVLRDQVRVVAGGDVVGQVPDPASLRRRDKALVLAGDHHDV